MQPLAHSENAHLSLADMFLKWEDSSGGRDSPERGIEIHNLPSTALKIRAVLSVLPATIHSLFGLQARS